ncbi:VOC family protein [Roseicyclus amphidinii]|uniref:VOC family protein n=1 Tax=Roseicyclus amphidinii TaxID=3034232 RepID=UPI0024E095E0|nr:VOC family protein [Roseicyclus sp. Amp-Y-6]
MRVIPYLFFPGTCREAITWYAEVLGADPPHFMTLADMPEADQAAMSGMPEDAVMNVALVTGDLNIMASDSGPDDTAPMAGVSIHLGLDSVAEALRVFDAFAADGEVGMPMAATFWTPAFGTVRDRFGVRWMVSVEEGVA